MRIVHLALWLAVGSSFAQKARPPKINTSFKENIFFKEIDFNEELECFAEGIPKPNYEWHKDGKNVTSSDTVRVEGGILKFHDPKASDAGRYQCFASNEHGRSMSNVVNVVEAKITGFLETFTTGKFVYREGEHATIPCHEKPRQSTPPAVFYWQQGNVDVVSSKEIVVDQTGTLHFINVKAEDQDGGMYRCYATNNVTATTVSSRPSVLTVHSVKGVPGRRPSISFYTSGPDADVLLGRNIWLQCIPDGSPLPEVRWSRVGGELPFGRHEIYPKNYTLKISNVGENDEGEYKCEAYYGSRTASHVIFVNVTSEPIWEEKMRSVTVTSGKTAEFTCLARSAVGDQDAVQVEWFKNGQPLKPGTQGKIKVSGSRLTVTDVRKPDDLMTVQCNVSNKIGYRLAEAFLNVIENTILIEEPDEKVLVRAGEFYQLRIGATVDPLYASQTTYTWSKDEQPIGTDKSQLVYLDNNFVIINTTTLDELRQVVGKYRCRVSLGIPGGEGNVETFTEVYMEEEEIPPPPEKSSLWWIALIVIAVIILIVILICCLVRRGDGDVYLVDEKERRAGHDPEQELAKGGIQNLSQADAFDEKKPYTAPDQVSLTNGPPMGSDTDSLPEYSEPLPTTFNADEYPLTNYGGQFKA